MRLPRRQPTTISLLTFLLPSLVTSVSIDCSDIRTDRTSWNLEKLGGPHSLYTVEEHDSKITNTTFTFDICQNLEKTKGVPKDEDCPNHSRVCAIKRFTNMVENKTTIIDTIPIAGDYGLSIGGNLDPKWKRLKSSDSPADREKEGVRLEINGGKDSEGQKQKAFIDFICIPKKAEERDLGEYLSAREDADKSGEEVDDGHDGKIKFRSWEKEEDARALRLDWLTHVFMGVAAYLIFGSWLNYNRYSARGWDLVPHSDTIRDIPYILKDWLRRVVDTVQGGGSRGGYSAV